jgi:hypothetical protein
MRRSVGVPFEMPLKISGKWSWAILILGVLSFCALGYLLITAVLLKHSAGPSPVALNEDPMENVAHTFSIRLPVNWSVFDKNAIKGHYPGKEPELISKCPPMGMRFAPQIMVNQIRARAFDLKNHVEEFKAHVKERDKTAEFLNEKELSLDGAPAMRLEYTAYHKENDWPEGMRLHLIAFLVEDGPDYFDLLGAASEDDYERYKDKLEASLRTFKRIQQKPEMKFESE